MNSKYSTKEYKYIFYSDQILWYVWPHFDSIFHIVVIIEIGFLCIQKEMAAPIAVGVI